jgi:mannose-6-phosphate isomerase-like protein (cupin superfamily)
VTTLDKSEGGDPACWAHLFPEGTEPAADAGGAPGLVDLANLSGEAMTEGAIWSQRTEDLDVNLLRFPPDHGIPAHVNAEVDVLLVGISGEGLVDVDGRPCLLRAGQALVISKGARRSIRSLSDPFAYLSCHRRLVGLGPRV